MKRMAGVKFPTDREIRADLKRAATPEGRRAEHDAIFGPNSAVRLVKEIRREMEAEEDRKLARRRTRRRQANQRKVSRPRRD